MKKFLIGCSMIGAAALVASADAVSATPKTQDLPWFNVTTSVTNGGAIAVASDATCEVKNSKFEIDSDLENLVTFTATDTLTQNLSRVTLTLDPSTIPSNTLPVLTSSSAKVAFALYNTTDTTTNFVAWVGSSWLTLTGGTIPTSSYVLGIEFDNSVTDKKVRFSVNSAALSYNSNEWISYGSTAIGPANAKIDFVGTGSVSSFAGYQLEVTGEIVPVGDKGVVDVPKADVDAVNATAAAKDYGSVDAFMSAEASSAYAGSAFQAGLTVGEAYAAGLLEKSGNALVAKDNGAIKVQASAQAIDDGNIPVNINIDPPAETGAVISYQLQGWTGLAWENVAGCLFNDRAAIKIPVSKIGGGAGQYRKFCVKVNVRLQSTK